MFSTIGRALQDLPANRMNSADGSGRLKIIADVATVRFMAVLLFRLSQIVGQRFSFAGAMIKQINNVLTGVDIAVQAQIGPGLILYHPSGVVIGPRCTLGSDVVIQQGVTIGTKSDSVTTLGDSPIIGDRVELGAGSKILGGIRVGDDVMVGANAVLITDAESGSIFVGVPAKRIS